MATKKKLTAKAATNQLTENPAFVDVELVRRALKFAAVRDVRYYLNGVCIRPSKSGGVLVLASNGHTALVLHDPNGRADKDYILPFCRGRNEKGLAERGASHVVVGADGTITVVGLAMTKLFICPERLIDATYPDLSSVAGKPEEYEPGIRGCINPEYLKCAIDSGGKSGYENGVQFFSKKANGGSSVMLFTTQGGFGLVMPMRADDSLERRITKDFGGSI